MKISNAAYEDHWSDNKTWKANFEASKVKTTFANGINPFSKPQHRFTATDESESRKARLLSALRERPWQQCAELVEPMGCSPSVAHSLLQVMHKTGQLERINIAGRWRYALKEQHVPPMDLSDDLQLVIALTGPIHVSELGYVIGHTTPEEISNLGGRLGKLYRQGELTRKEVERKFIYEVVR